MHIYISHNRTHTHTLNRPSKQRVKWYNINLLQNHQKTVTDQHKHDQYCWSEAKCVFFSCFFSDCWKAGGTTGSAPTEKFSVSDESDESGQTQMLLDLKEKQNRVETLDHLVPIRHTRVCVASKGLRRNRVMTERGSTRGRWFRTFWRGLIIMGPLLESWLNLATSGRQNSVSRQLNIYFKIPNNVFKTSIWIHNLANHHTFSQMFFEARFYTEWQLGLFI